LLGLLRGDVDFGQETLTAVLPQIKAGKLRALAVMMPERSQYLPQVPGLDELKMPQAAYMPFYGVALPAGTPAAIVEKLGRAIDEILRTPDAKEKMAAQSLDVVSKGTDEMRAFIRNDVTRFREIGKRLNIQIE
jgi:tripartite-type tricarboxylate transporter receptor subunit TctC